jgi:hypothetical protein
MRIVCVSLTVLGLLLLPAASGAKNVPPGNSGADQYSETLPGAGGNEQTNSGGGGGNPSSSQPALSPAAQESLEELGPAGRAAADLANRTAPRGAGKTAGRNGGAATRQNPSGSSAVLDVFKQAGGSSDSGGMGIALPLILAGSALAAFLFLRSRRRRPGAAEGAGGTG